MKRLLMLASVLTMTASLATGLAFAQPVECGVDNCGMVEEQLTTLARNESKASIRH